MFLPNASSWHPGQLLVHDMRWCQSDKAQFPRRIPNTRRHRYFCRAQMFATNSLGIPCLAMPSIPVNHDDDMILYQLGMQACRVWPRSTPGCQRVDMDHWNFQSTAYMAVIPAPTVYPHNIQNCLQDSVTLKDQSMRYTCHFPCGKVRKYHVRSLGRSIACIPLDIHHFHSHLNTLYWIVDMSQLSRDSIVCKLGWQLLAQQSVQCHGDFLSATSSFSQPSHILSSTGREYIGIRP
jgi:hypothetical protein